SRNDSRNFVIYFSAGSTERPHIVVYAFQAQYGIKRTIVGKYPRPPYRNDEIDMPAPLFFAKASLQVILQVDIGIDYLSLDLGISKLGAIIQCKEVQASFRSNNIALYLIIIVDAAIVGDTQLSQSVFTNGKSSRKGRRTVIITGKLTFTLAVGQSGAAFSI